MTTATWTNHGDYIQCDDNYRPDRTVVGYARVSTAKQNLEQQVADLKEAGCYRIYMEKKSTRKRRPIFESLKEICTRPGDVLKVWKIDRLGRDVAQLAKAVEHFLKIGVVVQSLRESIDLSTAHGRFSFNVIAAFSQLERDSISERTRAGMASQKKRGKRFGNHSKILGEHKIEMLIDIWNPELTNKQIASRNGYKSTATMFNHFQGEKKLMFAAKKQGFAEFKKIRMERFKQISRQEGVSLYRLSKILKSRNPIPVDSVDK